MQELYKIVFMYLQNYFNSLAFILLMISLFCAFCIAGRAQRGGTAHLTYIFLFGSCFRKSQLNNS